MRRLAIIIGILTFFSVSVAAQHVTLDGKIVDREKKEPVEFASVLIEGHELWAVTDKHGAFTIRRIPTGEVTLIVQCLGYVKRTVRLHLTKDTHNLRIELDEDNLKLEEVEVVAKRKSSELTTAYTIDRTTLDNQQLLNLSDLSVLLPGGKTVNSTLINDDRLSLRSNTSEKGNASFGTAVEVDGMRIDNNAMMGETTGTSTRNISSSNIESVEVVTGIPSVEYGDLSNGVVKVNTRKGKSPFIIEGKLNQHTYQMAVNKGFEFGRNRGLLNVSLERARSFSDIASPHTAYQRNILSVNYMNVFMKQSTPLTLNVAMTGNIGGYNSESDPDNNLGSYSKVRDNLFRTSLNLNWLLNKSWITNLQFKSSFSYQDKKGEDYEKVGAASTQPYIHTTEEGYFVAADYDVNPNANIILSPVCSLYRKGFRDQKPINYSLKLQADWTKRFGNILNKLMVGAEYKGSGNNGRGTYYEDMRYTPTWRPYRYDELPWMGNLALYAEEKVTVYTSSQTSKRAPHSALQLTMGMRNDITAISGSNYNNVSSISPRFNAKYTFWKKRKTWVSDLSIHAGWGKSVKLPSFQVLYPAPSYSDYLVFTPGSTVDNKSYYAYYTFPSKALYNPDLKWQYTNQADVGVEMNIKGTRITLSGFYHKTLRPYMSVYRYTPFQYVRTSQAAIEASGVEAAYRSYSIDQQTGIVTLTDLSGTVAPQELPHTTQRTYKSSMTYVNGSPVERYGLEWIVDFAQWKALRTSLRIDGNFYHYRGQDETLFAGGTTGSGSMDDTNYPLIGYYRGSSSTSAGTVSAGSIANGSESRQVNLNATLTTHIPKVRMIITLRLESSLYNYKRSLSRLSNGMRGIAVAGTSDYFGIPYEESMRDQYVVVYPEYYSTWDNPSELIPFAEKFLWAHDNDQDLYNQLAHLVVRNNYAYTLNPNYISKYFSANFSITKEIGDHISVSFYANNFFNNMKTVHSSQTDLDASLFSSSYIPSYYYGLSLRLKL